MKFFIGFCPVFLIAYLLFYHMSQCYNTPDFSIGPTQGCQICRCRFQNQPHFIEFPEIVYIEVQLGKGIHLLFQTLLSSCFRNKSPAATPDIKQSISAEDTNSFTQRIAAYVKFFRKIIFVWQTVSRMEPLIFHYHSHNLIGYILRQNTVCCHKTPPFPI